MKVMVVYSFICLFFSGEADRDELRFEGKKREEQFQAITLFSVCVVRRYSWLFLNQTTAISVTFTVIYSLQQELVVKFQELQIEHTAKYNEVKNKRKLQSLIIMASLLMADRIQATASFSENDQGHFFQLSCVK